MSLIQAGCGGKTLFLRIFFNFEVQTRPIFGSPVRLGQASC